MADLQFAVRLTGDGDDLRAEVIGVTKAYDGLDKQQDQVKKGGDELEKSGKRQSRMWKVLRTDVVTLQTAFAGLGLGLLARDLAKVGIEQEKYRTGLTAVVGDVRLAGEELQWLRAQADRIGVSFSALAQPYLSLRAAAKSTALTLEQQRDIFLSVVEAGRVFGLTAYEIEGALQAVQQMMSKGTVQAEELRGQLGERIPGAFQLAAKAMGVTTEELGDMLQKGEVLAEDLLPRLATELTEMASGGMAEAVNSAAAAFARLDNAIRDVKVALVEAGALDAMAKAAEWARDFVGGVGLLLQQRGVMSARDPMSFVDINELDVYIAEMQAGLRTMQETERNAARIGRDTISHRRVIMARLHELEALQKRAEQLRQRSEERGDIPGAPRTRGGGAGGPTASERRAALEEEERAAKQFDKTLQSILGSLDLQSQAFEQYRENLEVLAEAQRLGKITTEEHEEAVVALTESFAMMSDEIDRSAEKALEKQRKEQERATKAMVRQQEQAHRQMVRDMESFGYRLSDALVDSLMGARTSWRDFLRGMLGDMAKMLLRRNVVSPLMNILGSAIGGAFGGAAGGFGPATVGGQVMPWFHSGGLVASGGAARSMPAHGLAGDEVLGVLRRDEEVLTRSDPRHSANGGGGIVQNIAVDARGADAGVEMRIREGMAQAKREAVAEVFNQIDRGGSAAKISGRRR